MDKKGKSWQNIIKKSEKAIIIYNIVIIILTVILELGSGPKGSGGFSVLIILFLLIILVPLHCLIAILAYFLVKPRTSFKNLVYLILKIIGWNVVAYMADMLCVVFLFMILYLLF